MKLMSVPAPCPRRPCRSPYAYAGKARDGLDEGLDIVFNEMNRTIALLQVRINKWLVLLKCYRQRQSSGWIPGRELP